MSARCPVVCGCDEAGRGPLAGPVYAACCILDPEKPIAGLNDSKKLVPKRREALARVIREQAVAFAVARVDAAEIDRIGILNASLQAMVMAVRMLDIAPQLVLVDGNILPPDMPVAAKAIIGGDAIDPNIMAASILAKTSRDAEMMLEHERYPEYGFDRHKGYGTAAHMLALASHGPCPIHRRSFAPVRRLVSRLT